MFSDFQDDVLGFSFEIGGFWWNTSKHHRFNLYLLLELVSYRLYYFYYGIWTSLSFFCGNSHWKCHDYLVRYHFIAICFLVFLLHWMFSLLYWSWRCCRRWSHRVTVQKMNWYKKWKVSIREGLVCPKNLRCLRTKKLAEILHFDSWVMFVHIQHSCLVDPWDHVLPLWRFYGADVVSPLSCWIYFWSNGLIQFMFVMFMCVGRKWKITDLCKFICLRQWDLLIHVKLRFLQDLLC